MEEGLACAKRTDDPRTLATLYRGLCSLELGDEQYGTAHGHALASLREEERCENPMGLVTSLLRVADTSSHLGLFPEARGALDRAEPLVLELENRDVSFDFHATSRRLAERMGLKTEADRHERAGRELEARITANKDSIGLAQELRRKEIEAERFAAPWRSAATPWSSRRARTRHAPGAGPSAPPSPGSSWSWSSSP